jgi:hypothetical protein
MFSQAHSVLAIPAEGVATVEGLWVAHPLLTADNTAAA